MYSYVKAIVKGRGRTGRWSPADLSNVPIQQLWGNYSRIWVYLTHPTLPDVVALDLDLVRPRMGSVGMSTTIPQWLATLGNQSLPTQTELPELNTKYAEYRDGLHAGYTTKPVHHTAHPDAVLPAGAKHDLLLNKPGLDAQYFTDYCLPTVNGLYHRPDASPDGVYVIDGARSGRIANQTLFGVLSFERLGRLTTISIAPDLYYHPVGAGYGQYTYLKVPQDTTGKSVFFVLGGYLHLLSDTFTEVGDNLYRIDFNNYPWLERFFESRNLIDLSTVEAHLTLKNGNYDQVALEELYGDEAIEALLALPQSFIVVVDTPELFVDYEELSVSHAPGRYYTATTPIYPIVGGFGRTYDYWPVREDDMWVLQAQDTLIPEYNFNTISWWNELSVSAHRGTITPYRYARGRFLKIGKDL